MAVFQADFSTWFQRMSTAWTRIRKMEGKGKPCAFRERISITDSNPEFAF